VAQTIIFGNDAYKKIGGALRQQGVSKYLLVCGNSFDTLPVAAYLSSLDIPFVRFGGFTSNPKYEEVCEGVKLYRKEGCNGIVAVGGGSPIDVAKCIKLYAKMPDDRLYLQQEYTDTGIPLIAMPTTAGTGSESTRFAVIYLDGVKQSVHHTSIVPNYAILCADTLEHLPIYQKKCTLLDALCQAIESWWSVYSTPESIALAKQATVLLIQYAREYVFENTPCAREKIMQASNLAGQAIHITSTTSVHAMSYKMSSTYAIPHGHAVGIGLPKCWRYMQAHIDDCIDKRGKSYLQGIFNEIAQTLGGNTVEEGIAVFEKLLADLQISAPKAKQSDVELLVASVNTDRLKNNPVDVSKGLKEIYQNILGL
jgi:alcohol dehydrogenase class IV